MDQSTFDSPPGAAGSRFSTGGISGLSLASLLVLVASGYFVKFIRERRRSYRLFEQGNIPSIGEPRLFSGNLYSTYTKPDNVFIIDNYHKRLGATFGLFFGPDPWVQTTDLELLHRIFLAEDSVHVDRTLLNFPFTTEFGESLAQVRGEKWRQMRRFIAPSFHERQMKADNVNLEIHRISEQFLEFVKAHPKDQGGACKVEVDYAMKRFTLEVIFRLAFGQVRYERFGPTERDPFIDNVLKASLVFNGFALQTSIMFAPLRRLLGLFVPLTLLGSIMASIHAAIDKSLYLRHKLYEKVGRGAVDRKMIDSLIEGKDLGKMDNVLFRANLYFMLLAGHETTSFALTCLLFELAWAPQAQDRLRQDVLVRGERAEYLDWCIREAMRLHPPVPSGIGRILEHDIEHKGMKLPKGLSVNASIWSIHHSKEHWGADAEQFRPERMGEPIAEQALPVAQMRYFAFGYGIRGCVGKSLAKAEMLDLVSKLIVRYKIQPSPMTPRKLEYSSPNFYQWMLNKPFELEFTKVN